MSLDRATNGDRQRSRPLRFGKSRAGAEAAENPVDVVQRVLGQPLGDVLGAFPVALEALVSQELWKERSDGDGAQFTSFGAFCVARLPHGLNVRSLPPLLLIRHGLVTGRWYGEWVDILERHVRERGRPRNITNEDDFARAYKVSRSMNALDRILLTLKRVHHAIFEEVCALDISPREGAIKAGLIADPEAPRNYGVCDIDGAAKLTAKAQGDLLCKLFRALSLDAQCALISRALEGRLGAGLAQQWREGGKVAQ